MSLNQERKMNDYLMTTIINHEFFGYVKAYLELNRQDILDRMSEDGLVRMMVQSFQSNY